MPPQVLRRTLGLAGWDIPVIELAGAEDGPRLTVLAGVHGCEYAPMAAVRRWIRSLRERELRGSVRAVPVLNLPAFRARTPFVVPDDGKNLNRCFPGDPSGTLAQRLAHATFTQPITGSDALVDVHAGDMVEALEPFALYDAGPGEARARELAVAYGLGYVIRQEPGPDRAVGGTTSTAAAEIGIPAIIAEAGGCGLVEPAAVETHVRGLDRVLALLGMAGDNVAGGGAGDDADGRGGPDGRGRRRGSGASGGPDGLSGPGGPGGHGGPGGPGATPTHLGRFIWLRSGHEGWWEPAVRPGQPVAEGQRLGTVSSLDGAQVLQTITAPTAGVPLFVTSSPAAATDGLLLGLGAK